MKTLALGSKLPLLPHYQARRLKMKDPRIVKTYTESLNAYLTDNGFFSRLAHLSQEYTVPLTPNQEKEYEKLDIIRQIGMTKAEKNCRKLCLGRYQWSPIFQIARDRIKYFKLSLSRLRGC